MKDVIIFDLDGTLALINHRRHFVENGNNDWKSFYLACVDDKPNFPVIRICNALATLHKIWIVSGRSDEVSAETIKWLDDHNIIYDRIFMRKAGDYTADDIMKQKMIGRGDFTVDNILCAFDDRDRVVKMWRQNGIPCFQVAEGDF
jgi:hypothetical protein